MTYTNNATHTRKELLYRLCKLLVADQLESNIDRIPLIMRPKAKLPLRCCVHKDRAVLKYKIMALLGFNMEDEVDELTTLSQYAADAQQRNALTPIIMTVVDEACSSCQKGGYHVSNQCQGCEARPCAGNCPKDAISFFEGKAQIDEDLCVNCGKCQIECPFHAIIYRPVPCEEACPVGAITKDEHGIERINYDKCIYCGRCIAACPYGAIIEKSHIIEIFKAWKNNKEVVALVAPSIAAQFRQPLSKIYAAIKACGFQQIIEVAEGAQETIAHESEEWLHRMKEGHKTMTTSCCHAYTELVNKHIPDLKKMVSDTPSPMAYTGRIASQRFPDAVKVFVSPCTSKRHEALLIDDIDYVLSFEELGALIIANDVEVGDMDELNLSHQGCNAARNFAHSGGVTQAIRQNSEGEFKPEIINGINKQSIRLLKQIAKGKTDANFVEVMSCENGCIGGVNTIMKGRQAQKAFDANVNS